MSTTQSATRPHSAPDRPDVLKRMIQPQSVTLVGASAQLNKLNGRPLKHLLEKGYAGKIYPVNPKYEEIAGLRCYPSIAELPEAPDLAIIAVPAGRVAASLRELGKRGGRAAVIFSSGFSEMGEEGLKNEQELQAIAREYDLLLCGPNCLGFINAFENVYATFSQYADGPTNAGPIGFVTQSGAFGTAIAALVRQRGLGLGYFINTGNESDANFSELMSAVVEDPRIRVAAGYLEGIRDVQGLVDLARKCHELGKPLVLTKVGRTASGARAAASHTGSLAVEDALFDAITRQYGILRARNEEQMLDMLEVLAGCEPPQGKGVAIITQSGGAGVMMTDRAEEVGLEIPVLQNSTQAALADAMPSFGASGNPVDVTGQFVAEPALLRKATLAVLEDPNIHIGIIWLQLMWAHAGMLVELFAEIKAQARKPLLICWVGAPEGVAARLREHGLVMFGAGERAIEAAATLWKYEQARRKYQSLGAAPAAQAKPAARLADGAVPTVEAVALLEAVGVPMAPVCLARTADEAVAAWRQFGRAVALKIESPQILHKTDIDGVALGLDDEAAVRETFDAISRRSRELRPDATVAGLIVQPMSAGHIELVIGVKRDDVFGMMIMVGYGGILLEVLRDVTFRRAPFSPDEALEMLNELHMRPVFDGVRGRAPVDMAQLSGLLSSLSQWADGMSNQLAELDLNPVLIGSDGPVGVDCVMLIRANTGEPS